MIKRSKIESLIKKSRRESKEKARREYLAKKNKYNSTPKKTIDSSLFKETKQVKIYCAGCLEGIEKDSIFDGDYWWHKKCYDEFYKRMGFSPLEPMKTRRTAK